MIADPISKALQAAAGGDSDARWEHVCALHGDGSADARHAAIRLCESHLPAERALGADILGQLGGSEPSSPHREQSAPVLANLLLDASAEVAECALIAMGHLELEVDGVILTSLAAHPSADVRYAVAVALPNSGGAMTSALLVLLMDDPDDDVRNWATFGLGSMAEDDSPQIREALLARTADAHDETRGEALVGLALRRDLRVIAPLLRELESGCVGRLAVEAARDIGAP